MWLKTFCHYWNNTWDLYLFTSCADSIPFDKKIFYMTDPDAVDAARRQCPSDSETLIWFMHYWFFEWSVSTMLLVLTEWRKISPIEDADAKISPWTFYAPKFFIQARELTLATWDLIVEYTCLWFFISHILTKQSLDPAAM